MRPIFFLREALRGLSRNSAPALAALLTVLLTALVLGVFIPIVQATTGTADEVRGRVVVDVFVKEGTTPGRSSASPRDLAPQDSVGMHLVCVCDEESDEQGERALGLPRRPRLRRRLRDHRVQLSMIPTSITIVPVAFSGAAR